MADIVTFSKGASIPRVRTSIDFDTPYLHYGDIYKLYNKEVNLENEYDSIIKVSVKERVRDDQLLDTGDIVYNLTSESKEDLGKAVVIKNDRKIKFISGTETTIMKIIKKDVVFPDFLNYVLMTTWYLDELRKSTTGTKVYRVHPRAISKIKIPVPSIEKQKHIVSILDKLDALVNDISIGLPAELKGRRSQYKYYRNQLLTFPELKSNEYAK